MEVIFIRHGHGEHLTEYPHRLNTLHPKLTSHGVSQVLQLGAQKPISHEALVMVSPTKRTIETAYYLLHSYNFFISPFVGPRMFPQNKKFPTLQCDIILSQAEIIDLYKESNIIDFGIDCWQEGINTIDQYQFESYGKLLFDWIRSTKNQQVVIISHDGTITSYRELLGEQGLTREDFLGEAGIYRMKI